MFSFVEIRFFDVLDIVLGAYFMYLLYKLIKGTVAVNIIVSIVGFVLVWLVVRALKMSMMTAIMDSFMSIGLLALIIIFQQEVRRFLVLLGTRYDFLRRMGFIKSLSYDPNASLFSNSIVAACENMSKSKTGALIVIKREMGLNEFIATGDELNSKFSSQLIETIFFKNTPLHDGAMIVDKQKIIAAACILPVSQNMDVPKSFGLRHRSAMGITEATDAVAIVVSEETGRISYFENGLGIRIKTPFQLSEMLEKI